jgi:hypothetical protein
VADLRTPEIERRAEGFVRATAEGDT